MQNFSNILFLPFVLWVDLQTYITITFESLIVLQCINVKVMNSKQQNVCSEQQVIQVRELVGLPPRTQITWWSFLGLKMSNLLFSK